MMLGSWYSGHRGSSTRCKLGDTKLLRQDSSFRFFTLGSGSIQSESLQSSKLFGPSFRNLALLHEPVPNQEAHPVVTFPNPLFGKEVPILNTICLVKDESFEPSKVAIPSFRGTPLSQELESEANLVDVFPNPLSFILDGPR
ncbi:hypothetical protein SUGI_0615990 [Cryptomeria japonica]|nr:hypothetical protein SUGI_0615990 [Cryptomeria japonica]